MAPEPSATDVVAPPKRSRARRTERVPDESETIPSVSKPAPSGLLTPESSCLNESQIAPPSADSDEAVPLPPHIFPFMKLPAELRLHIYHMALVRSEPIALHVDRAPEKAEEDVSSDLRTWPSPALVVPGMPADTLPSRPERRIARPMTNAPNQRDDCDRPDPLSDPVVPVLLRLNRQIYKEARQLLYSENVFTLSLASGIYTLATLHQRSRSLIKHVVLTIPSHHDILDGFADLVRLGLRYCWGLKSFKIILQASLPDDGRTGGATSVYANAFHILRWLPRGCSVVLEGCVSEMVRKVVVEEGRLMNVLDEVSWLKRQRRGRH
jgi:epsin